MATILETAAIMNSMIAEELLNNSGANPEDIAKAVRARIDQMQGGREWLGYIPIEHIKNLVRKKMKENELMIYLGDPKGRDDEIRKELQAIREDIQKTRPNFLIQESLFSSN